MTLLMYQFSAGSTGRKIWENPSTAVSYPKIRIFNSGATDAYLRASSCSSGSSESSGFMIRSSQYSHEITMNPGEALYAYTTAGTAYLQVSVWGEVYTGASAAGEAGT